MYKTQKKLLGLALVIMTFTCIFAFLPACEAHILVIGDSKSDYYQSYDETSKLAKVLKSKGYDVLALYRDNATTKNVLKGMYDADAVIYAGHGGYQFGHYDENGGSASPPFSLVGSDDFIWGVGGQMREGWDEDLFTAPFKQNIPVILLHACFSTGWVEEYDVANPTETIYNFARMFTGAGANFYATAWNGAEIVYDFLNGATSFADANNKNYEKITTSTIYNGTQVWRNNHTDDQHSFASFVGNWSGKFPTATETTAYDDAAAERWYNGNRIKDALISRFKVSSAPYYINQLIKFTEYSTDTDGYITNYIWKFGDGNSTSSTVSINPSHNYTKPGTYTVTHTVIDNNTKNSSSVKTLIVSDRNPVANFYLTTSNLRPKISIGFRSSSYDPDNGDNIISYSWRFGDGSKGSGSYIKHTYAKEGTYTVTLTVKDKFGKTSSKSKKIAVKNPKSDLVITKAYKYRGYLYVTVKNKGKVTSRACYTRAWYGRYYKNIYTYKLKPGSSRKYRVYFRYRHGKAKVDYYKIVIESNEKNNLKYF